MRRIIRRGLFGVCEAYFFFFSFLLFFLRVMMCAPVTFLCVCWLVLCG